jgi:glyoxylase-like metal-dependent hydrolase (beta-lactamase superfamily II)
MLHRDVAPGIHRIEDAFTNWYLVEGDAGLTIVDAGVPTSWDSLQSALGELGRRRQDVKALVLTHGHFDHIGFAERARRELGIPVHLHRDDRPLTRNPRAYGRERPLWWYLVTQVQALPIVIALVRNRAWWPEPIERVEYLSPGHLDVPGRPHVIHTPGHTLGHCVLHFRDRDTVIAGDALVMLDPYRNWKGPRLVSRAATADVERNLETLEAVAQTGARTVLTGHGEPWRDGAAEAVRVARQAGAG